MWIKEWEKLIQFANTSIQQPGINNDINSSNADGPPRASQAKRKGESFPGDSLASNGTQNHNQQQQQQGDFHSVGNSRPPPLMMPHNSSQYSNDFQASGSFDQDINEILELDGLTDFPIMSGGINPGMGNLPIPNQNSHLQQNYSNYGSTGGEVSYGLSDYSVANPYHKGNDNFMQNHNDNNLGPGNEQNYQVDNFTRNQSDNFQNAPDSYGDQNNNFQPDYSNEDKANLDTFDDLDCATDYLPNTHILGKRKVEESYFDSEQPSKYSKTEPM